MRPIELSSRAETRSFRRRERIPGIRSQRAGGNEREREESARGERSVRSLKNCRQSNRYFVTPWVRGGGGSLSLSLVFRGIFLINAISFTICILPGILATIAAFVVLSGRVTDYQKLMTRDGRYDARSSHIVSSPSQIPYLHLRRGDDATRQPLRVGMKKSGTWKSPDNVYTRCFACVP